MSDQLKPCPFCGCTDIRFVASGWMRCAGCMCRGPIDDTDWPNGKDEAAKNEAIRLWNRRQPEAKPLTVEQINICLKCAHYKNGCSSTDGAADCTGFSPLPPYTESSAALPPALTREAILAANKVAEDAWTYDTTNKPFVEFLVDAFLALQEAGR